MKKQWIVLVSILLIGCSAIAQTKACDPDKEKNFKSLSKPNKAGGYGAVITTDGAIPLSQVEHKMQVGKHATLPNVKIMGKVDGVCKTKGCWMEVDKGNGEKVRVRFKDYAFFVPRNCEGQMVYALGTARYDTTSVEMLRHYAGDAGKTKAEIDAINKPEIELTFEASGVLFDKK